MAWPAISPVRYNATVRECNMRRILLVEDEFITALSLKTMLETEGHFSCKMTGNGQNAIELCKKFKPELMIIDIGLPGVLDGIETYEVISNQAEMPVIFISGYSDERNQSRAEEMNPIGYFIKPLVESKLLEVIESYFDDNL